MHYNFNNKKEANKFMNLLLDSRFEDMGGIYYLKNDNQVEILYPPRGREVLESLYEMVESSYHLALTKKEPNWLLIVVLVLALVMGMMFSGKAQTLEWERYQTCQMTPTTNIGLGVLRGFYDARSPWTNKVVSKEGFKLDLKGSYVDQVQVVILEPTSGEVLYHEVIKTGQYYYYFPDTTHPYFNHTYNIVYIIDDHNNQIHIDKPILWLKFTP